MSMAEYACLLDAKHRSLGFGALAHQRQKIYRWESGRASPEPSAQMAIAELHGVPTALVKTVKWPDWLAAALSRTNRTPSFGDQTVTVEVLTDLAGGGPVDRRKFLIMSSAALGVSIAGWQDAVAAMTSPVSTGRRQITPHMMDHLEVRLDHLRHLDDALGSAQLRGLAMAEFGFIVGLVQEARFDEHTGRRLYSAAAEAARCCAWVHFDDGYHAQAERYFDASLRASATAGDPLVGAYALSFRAIQHYTAGDPRDAVALVEAARAQTKRKATPRFRAMLAARAARSYSKAGDRRACARALDDARDLLDAGPHDDDPSYLYWVDRGEVEMIAGSSALELGDHREALRGFDAAIDANYAGDEQYPRTHAIYLARAADAHLALGDFDQAVTVAEHAVRCLGGVDSARSTATMDDLRGKLTEHRHVRVVGEFLELTA
ncbi:transcriptional regulator [Nonomuraea sp. NN258]|uniref:transcriptional regulator n=1 Tax=Nonomuraea antri TaxID=2730852 RepID=UPI001569085E|nr:transcriptional regulator [Nonomuraea antri]NRQ33949.1 transcriptional regulator [Nonomuraea antri]